MKYGNEIKNICHLAWPAIIQEAMNTVVTYVDTAMVGSMGATASAAVGLTSTVTWLLGSISVAFGVDLEAYAEGKMDTVTIGNAEYTAMPESNSIEKTYMYRYEQSGTSYDIRVRGQEIDDSDKELLEGIVLKLEDEGNKDAPWPWEGEPVEPVLAEQMVGSYTIVPKYIPFKEAQGVMQIMDHQFVKQGNQVFHLLENKLDTYEYSESGLEFVSSMELDDDFEYLSGDSSGMLYLSPGIGDVIGVKDGKKALQTTVDGDLNMHPSGEWGISFWVNSDTQKIANQGGNLTAEPWILTGLNKDEERKGLFSMIDDVQITNSHIMVAGSAFAARFCEMYSNTDERND